MVNKPKAIGTAAESAVVNTAKSRGFPLAERLALAGDQDRGDVRLTIGVHLEVKGGKTAEQASDNQVWTWMGELDRELSNANAMAGALITKRKGYGADRAHAWWAHVRASWLAEWRCYPTEAMLPIQPDHLVRMTLDSLFVQLRAAGHGDALNHEEDHAP